MRRGTELRTPATASSERGARESGDEESIGGASGETEACPNGSTLLLSGDVKRFFVLLVHTYKRPSSGRYYLATNGGNGGVKVRSELAKPIWIDDCDVAHVLSVGSHGGAVDDAVWSRSEEGGRGMDAELTGARASARRAERVEYRPVGAAAVRCERGGVGEKSRGDGSTDGDGVGTAGRVGDDAQSGEVLAKLVSHVARSQQRAIVEHVLFGKLGLVSRVAVRVVNVEHHDSIALFDGEAIAHHVEALLLTAMRHPERLDLHVRRYG